MERISEDNQQQAVIAAEEALAAAHLSLDLAVFEWYLHDTYVIVQPGGAVEDKAATLASLRSGTRRWEIAKSDRFEVRLYGKTAVIVGRWRGKGQNGDQPFDYSARFISVWVWENGRWQNITSQSTPIP